MGFQITSTGYRADDEQIAFWNSRDICPACDAIVTPHSKTPDGKSWRYLCQCDHVEWTRES